jgi:arabinofuranosyltransferase
MMALRKSDFKPNPIYLIVAAVVFLIVLLRTAWISDDAYITLRVVLNFTTGHGPIFNWEERVQAYTHPVWFLLLSLGTYVFGHVEYVTFAFSIATSLAVFVALLRWAPQNYYAMFLVGLLACLSKSFVDFSSSGLENPLSHALLLLIVFISSLKGEDAERRILAVLLLCSVLYLNRQDLVLIVFPLIVYLLVVARLSVTRNIRLIAIAASPALLWLSFSLFYYGFPFPNTAYAKLGTGIDLDVRIPRGIEYLRHSVVRDPVTLFGIAVGSLFGLFGGPIGRSLVFGVCLYLCYIVSIGGDFMEGRFLSAPFVVSLAVLGRGLSSKPAVFALTIPTLILGRFTIGPNVLAGPAYSNVPVPSNGVADERGVWLQKNGLLSGSRLYKGNWPRTGTSVNQASIPTRITCGGLGRESFQSPAVHFIDPCALTDPLLARLPTMSINMRVGHFLRHLPVHYDRSIQYRMNLLSDPKTKRYWESLRTVTRGALLSPDRIAEIVKLNLGLIEKPDFELYRSATAPKSPELEVVPENDVRQIVPQDSPWDLPGNMVFANTLEVVLAQKVSVASIDISVDCNDEYQVAGLRNNEWIPLTTINPSRSAKGLARSLHILPNTVADVEKIRITGKSGDGYYSLGHLLLNP